MACLELHDEMWRKTIRQLSHCACTNNVAGFSCIYLHFRRHPLVTCVFVCVCHHIAVTCHSNDPVGRIGFDPYSHSVLISRIRGERWTHRIQTVSPFSISNHKYSSATPATDWCVFVRDCQCDQRTRLSGHGKNCNTIATNRSTRRRWLSVALHTKINNGVCPMQTTWWWWCMIRKWWWTRSALFIQSCGGDTTGTSFFGNLRTKCVCVCVACLHRRERAHSNSHSHACDDSCQMRIVAPKVGCQWAVNINNIDLEKVCVWVCRGFVWQTRWLYVCVCVCVVVDAQTISWQSASSSCHIVRNTTQRNAAPFHHRHKFSGKYRKTHIICSTREKEWQRLVHTYVVQYLCLCLCVR